VPQLDESGESVPTLPASRSPWLRVVSILASVVALVGVIVWASRQKGPQLPSEPGEWLALVAAIGLYASATTMRGERWWWLLRDSEVEVRRTDAYGLTVVSYMGNNVLPARAGDVMRVLLIPERSRREWRPVVGTLITERLLDVLFLLTLFALLAFAILPGIETPEGDFLLVAGGTCAAIAGAVGVLLWASRSHAWAQRTIAWITPLAEPTRRLTGSHALGMAALTLVIWTLEILTYLAVASSVGLEMSLAEAGYVIAVAGVFLLIPSGPGYVGTLDAGLLFGLDAIGASGSEALSYLLTARFVVFVPVTVAGLGIFLWRYRGVPGGRTKDT
jgi:glycosyltransferase 2 family protein